ncbi:hypothetical protein NHN17_18855 [Photobacterium sp. ZSDE20]|uniref:Uncharacterized protein n=1 Tax=Photobacterium pectinilyticum TaxID=2906793 RepID=A0ABT1N5T5_9GAMM|nr:hypothetical protein [Photobacterium sp. ZSDE20]MCQ1060108.1 hypothetical protein [Photobacterium sp. ZSDE20]
MKLRLQSKIEPESIIVGWSLVDKAHDEQLHRGEWGKFRFKFRGSQTANRAAIAELVVLHHLFRHNFRQFATARNKEITFSLYDLDVYRFVTGTDDDQTADHIKMYGGFISTLLPSAMWELSTHDMLEEIECDIVDFDMELLTSYRAILQPAYLSIWDIEVDITTHCIEQYERKTSSFYYQLGNPQNSIIKRLSNKENELVELDKRVQVAKLSKHLHAIHDVVIKTQPHDVCFVLTRKDENSKYYVKTCYQRSSFSKTENRHRSRGSSKRNFNRHYAD